MRKSGQKNIALLLSGQCLKNSFVIYFKLSKNLHYPHKLLVNVTKLTHLEKEKCTHPCEQL